MILSSSPDFIKMSVLLGSLFIIVDGPKNIQESNPAAEEPIPAYAGTETIIRSKYDRYAVFTWEQYTLMLDILSQPKFKVLPINDMRKTSDESKVIVGMRHDVDFNPFKALEMAELEMRSGIRATYYFLATAEYYGSIDEKKLVRSPGIDVLFKKIAATGAEIGIHNDLLSVMIIHKMDPWQFNKEELSFYKSLGIQIRGTASHGSQLAKLTVPNYQIFSDYAKSDSVRYEGKAYTIGNHSLKEYGFKYEAYFTDYSLYISDSGGKWNDPKGFPGILNILESSRPGDRIQILIHPDWWGKN
jgi:hypothetical protein